jgi:RNA polymerase sigma factor FliA
LEVDEFNLWQSWRGQNDVGARDTLVLKYSPWARMLAKDVYLRVYRIRDAWQDCAQNAVVGMLEAMQRFDPSIGPTFQTFARSRVRGAVFDGLRELDDSFRQPGDSEERGRLAERVESLRPNAADDEDDPLEAFVNTTVGLGLGFLLDMQSIPQHAAPHDAYSETERTAMHVALARRLEKLDERERTILTLHYYHQLPFVDIAEQLQLTKGRISQLHKRALERLRWMLRGSRADDW